MADHKITLIVQARDLASKVLRGINGSAASTARSFASMRNIGIAGAFIALALVIGKTIAAIRRWRDEYVAAVHAAGRAELQFAKQLRDARKPDPRIIQRRNEAEIKAAGGVAGAGDKSKTAAVEREVRTNEALLVARQTAEAGEQEEKIDGLVQERKMLLLTQAAADALAEKYKGAAGAAEMALERVKQWATVEGKSIQLSGPAASAADLETRQRLRDDIRAKISKAENEVVEVKARQTETEKARQQAIQEGALLETRIATERINLGNLIAAQDAERVTNGIEGQKKLSEANAEAMQLEAENYRERAKMLVDANRTIETALRTGKQKGRTPEELENLQAVGIVGGLEGAIKSKTREEDRKARIRAQAVERARRLQETGGRLSPMQRRLLAAEEAAKQAAAMGKAAVDRETIAAQLDKSETGKSIQASAKFLDDLRKDLKANLRGI